MPLITERSFVGWAEKLAGELGEPLPEIVHALGLALLKKELSAFFDGREIDLSNPYPGTLWERLVLTLPFINNRAVFEWSYLGVGNGNDQTPLKEALDDFIIKDADMRCWLKSRGVVNATAPATAPTRDEAIKALIATYGKSPGRGGMRHKKFAKEVRELSGAEATDPGFSDEAIAQAVRRLLHKNSDKIRQPVGNVIEFVGNIK